jgi:hypothetical protein
MNELVAIEDLCATFHKEVADLEKERRELQEAASCRKRWPTSSVRAANRKRAANCKRSSTVATRPRRHRRGFCLVVPSWGRIYPRPVLRAMLAGGRLMAETGLGLPL